MSVRWLIIFVVIFETVFAQNGAPCITPNNQNGTCMILYKCEVIMEAIETLIQSAMDFVAKSKCGEKMVCCGSVGYLMTTENPIRMLPNLVEGVEPYTIRGLPDKSVCGLQKKNSRIYGGNETDLGEFPWVAALEYRYTNSQIDAGIRCGGSIITKRYVLTAAHCLYPQKLELKSVRLGEWNIITDPDCEAEGDCADPFRSYKIIRKIEYHSYKKSTSSHDIGLLQLEAEIEFTDYIRPICLPVVNVSLATTMTVVGWGRTETAETSNVQLKVNVPLLEHSVCFRDINETLSTNQLCAGGVPGQDSCVGDSGGPLMVKYEEEQRGRWYQEGIVSWGHGCAHGTRPAIYTRVYGYVDWIINIVTGRRGNPCITPNGENVMCVALRSCKVIYDAILTRSSNAIQFAKDSQCGFDPEPMVCCGSSGYPTMSFDIFKLFTNASISATTPDYSDIFQKPRVNEETEEKIKEELDNTILQDFNTKALPDRTVCGLEKREQSIYGGEIAELDEFPWMVALEYKSKRSGVNAGIRCGGSLINNRFVITAAHCIISKEFQLIKVLLGDWNITSDPDCHGYGANIECANNVIKVNIQEEIPHPFYSKKTGNNDIGLLRLATDVKYTDYIRPICLPPPDLPSPIYGTKLTVAGWGATEKGASSDIKLKVEVPLLSNTICDHLKDLVISANQLCAGGEAGKDACQGDSGGPLMRAYAEKVNRQVQWYQEGVVSVGVGCGSVGYPAVYTRVSRYISWIINNLKSD